MISSTIVLIINLHTKGEIPKRWEKKTMKEVREKGERKKGKSGIIPRGRVCQCIFLFSFFPTETHQHIKAYFEEWYLKALPDGAFST